MNKDEYSEINNQLRKNTSIVLQYIKRSTSNALKNIENSENEIKNFKNSLQKPTHTEDIIQVVDTEINKVNEAFLADLERWFVYNKVAKNNKKLLLAWIGAAIVFAFQLFILIYK